MAKKKTPDIQFDNLVSFISITPLTDSGKEWISDNLHFEPWQCMGDSIYVDHRCAYDIADAASADGLSYC